MLYQRRVIAYHGCLADRHEAAMLRGKDPPVSTALHDWLGQGIYFWEHGPERAWEWAQQKCIREDRPLEDARVLGAIIELGHCFDLLDRRHTEFLTPAHQFLVERVSSLPENLSPSNSKDVLLRNLDCAVINIAAGNDDFQTVRGAFWEGGEAFPGAMVQEMSHIQIAVRDPSCIIGYFAHKRIEGSHD